MRLKSKIVVKTKLTSDKRIVAAILSPCCGGKTKLVSWPHIISSKLISTNKTILCLFFCCCHWILEMICLKVGKIFILDPLDVDESKYKEFVECIQ